MAFENSGSEFISRTSRKFPRVAWMTLGGWLIALPFLLLLDKVLAGGEMIGNWGGGDVQLLAPHALWRLPYADTTLWIAIYLVPLGIVWIGTGLGMIRGSRFAWTVAVVTILYQLFGLQSKSTPAYARWLFAPLTDLVIVGDLVALVAIAAISLLPPLRRRFRAHEVVEEPRVIPVRRNLLVLIPSLWILSLPMLFLLSLLSVGGVISGLSWGWGPYRGLAEILLISAMLSPLAWLLFLTGRGLLRGDALARLVALPLLWLQLVGIRQAFSEPLFRPNGAVASLVPIFVVGDGITILLLLATWILPAGRSHFVQERA